MVAIWAVGSAVIAFLSRSLHHASRARDAYIQCGILVLLAILVELTRGDPVMMIGFFGAYAMIAGVFQGISAFDLGRDTPDASQKGGEE